ncbi:MAG: HEAT repeat domain-containing protein [Planctomycetes bacterium]|nr:HEAT repeat domain-containing protein [Planctomycetota bacterium]
MHPTTTIRFATCALTLALLGKASADDVPLLYADALRPAHESYLRDRAKELGDPDPKKRRAAIHALADAGDAGAATLLESIGKTQNGVVLRSALLALGDSGSPAAVAELRRLYEKGGQQEGERAVLALVLGVVGPGSAAQTLRNEASSRKPSTARLAATLGLGRCGDGEALAESLSGLGKESLEEQRAAIVLAAGEARARGAAFAPGTFGVALRDRGAQVRRAGALAIALRPDVADASALQDAWKREKVTEVRVALVLALGGIDDARIDELLLTAARGKAGEVRDAALVALAGRSGGAWIDATRSVRESVVLEVAALGCAAAPDSTVAQTLVEWLASAQPGLRSAAGLALAAMRSAAARDAVLDWAARETDLSALDDALLAVGVLDLPAALDRVGELRTPTGRVTLSKDTRKTLEGRRDARLLEDQLERRLRARHARRADRIADAVAELVDEILDLDDIARRLPTTDSGAGSGSGSGSGRVRKAVPAKGRARVVARKDRERAAR